MVVAGGVEGSGEDRLGGGGATLVDGMVEEVAVVEAVEWAAAEVPNIREVFDTKLLGLGLRRLYA